MPATLENPGLEPVGKEMSVGFFYIKIFAADKGARK